MSNLFKTRLKQLREKRNLLQQDMSVVLGISKSAYGFYEQGKREPDFNTLSTLADYFNTTVDYLLGRSDVKEPSGSHQPQQNFGASIPVPILGTIRAGPDGFLQEEFLGNIMTEKRLINSNPHFWLEVRGDSMIGFSINDGDLVLISKEPCYESGKICAVVVSGTEATLKRIRYQDDGIMLESGNPSFPARFFAVSEIESGEINIIGVAKQIRRLM